MGVSHSWKGHVTVIGCGLGRADISTQAHEIIAGADVLAGGRRLLRWFPDFPGETIEVAAHAADTVKHLTQKARRDHVVVLASGDALFFGIGRMFIGHVPPDALTILPNVTAAQAALARLKIPWETARFFSVHGRTAPLAWRRILHASPAVVYADAERSPARIARELIARFPAAARREGAIVANLGANEIVRRGTLQALCHVKTGELSMLIVSGTEDAGPISAPPVSLGLPDDDYTHEGGLITHPEVRAVVLSKLRIGPGVMWDLGAGSGSVGLEAAGLCDQLRVYAVEKSPGRCSDIEHNARVMGCAVQVVQGTSLSVMRSLPAPRCVFVGGGGTDIRRIVEKAFAALRPGGTLVAAAVLVETRAALIESLPKFRTELLELDIRRARALGHGHLLEPDHPITICVYHNFSTEGCAHE